MILDELAAALPHAQRYTFNGAGHVPQLTHADEYVKVIARFIEGATVAEAR